MSWFGVTRGGGGGGTCNRKSCVIGVKQPCKMWLKQLIIESNQIGSCDIMGPTPGSRARVASRVHPGLGRGEQSWLTLAIDPEDAIFST